MTKRSLSLLFFALALLAQSMGAQQFPRGQALGQFPVDDPVIKAIWDEGMENSHIYSLAQTLSDSIGPRLPGSPAFDAGADWVLRLFGEWGLEGRKDEYGTWRAWQRGITHVDLLEPRVRTLDATMQAWSPGTDGPVTSEAVVIPKISDPGELDAFLATVRGKFVLLGPAEPTCRPNSDWEQWATPQSWEDMRALKQELTTGWRNNLQSMELTEPQLIQRLEEAGVAGVLTARWAGNWGAHNVGAARNAVAPNISFSCEDYGLVYRLAESGQGPVVRVNAEVEDLGIAPTYNIIGEIRGTEKPDEYIILSAHFDSWDGASGATDNNTGTVTMMEAARILKKVYPNPKRTILVALWNGEEQGLHGSRAFVEDHPDIVEGIQALFNQDNGTGRVVSISMQGFTEVGSYFGGWMAALPEQISSEINLVIPGNPGRGGSDFASFVCAGVPAFSLRSLSWSYRQTYHNVLDTFDKIVIDDVINNAILTAMLTYLASEEEDKLPRTKRILEASPLTGEPMPWPECRPPARNADGFFFR